MVYKRPTDLKAPADVPVCCNLLLANVLDEGGWLSCRPPCAVAATAAAAARLVRARCSALDARGAGAVGIAVQPLLLGQRSCFAHRRCRHRRCHSTPQACCPEGASFPCATRWAARSLPSHSRLPPTPPCRPADQRLDPVRAPRAGRAAHLGRPGAARVRHRVRASRGAAQRGGGRAGPVGGQPVPLAPRLRGRWALRRGSPACAARSPGAPACPARLPARAASLPAGLARQRPACAAALAGRSCCHTRRPASRGTHPDSYADPLL